jgi:hypothetical protein
MMFRRLINISIPLPVAGALPPATRGSRGERGPIGRPAVLALASIALMLIGIGSGPAKAENPDISSRRASERTDFTNDEIKDGFFKIAFNAELQLGAPAELDDWRHTRSSWSSPKIYRWSMWIPV